MQPAFLEAPDEESLRPPLPRESASLRELRSVLRARVAGVGLPVDMALAPIDHLFDHPGSTLRFAREPVCYYANHQTSYESFLFSYIDLALAGVPLLVVTHTGLFDNDYGEHCALLAEHLRRLAHPAAHLITVVAVPHELRPARDFLIGLKNQLDGRSLLVHVGGWREYHEGQPVQLMAKDLMEGTLRLRRRIAPVRFSGGLPGESLGYKFHLPYRMGRLPFHAQRRRVLHAINAMAPPFGAYAGQPNFGLTKRCLRRHVETGSSALKCFLLEALGTMPDPSHETDLLRYFIRYGVLPTDGVADAEWLARQAMWISDGRGLKTV
jgi:hypothetical protein